MESFRLEKISRIIKSKHEPHTAKAWDHGCVTIFLLLKIGSPVHWESLGTAKATRNKRLALNLTFSCILHLNLDISAKSCHFQSSQETIPCVFPWSLEKKGYAATNQQLLLTVTSGCVYKPVLNNIRGNNDNFPSNCFPTLYQLRKHAGKRAVIVSALHINISFCFCFSDSCFEKSQYHHTHIINKTSSVSWVYWVGVF